MPRNIAKPFVMTLSLIDITPLTPKYRCFYGEDVELIISVVDEFKKPVDISDSMVKVYYICDGEDLRQDDRITITDAEKGELRVLTSKNYLRVGTNDVRIILYDNDQEVYLQPATIICKATDITPEGGEVIYPEYNVKDELNKTNARVSTLEDDNAVNKENISVLEEVVPTKADLVDLNLERERINNIIAVENSTDNLETADIRVDADGNTHPSAGDAVRAQVKELNKNVFPAKKDYFGNEHLTVPDRLNEDFDNVHQRINKSELLEYNDTTITAEKSYYGLTKEHSIGGRTLQNVMINCNNSDCLNVHKHWNVVSENTFTVTANGSVKYLFLKKEHMLLKPSTVYTILFEILENSLVGDNLAFTLFGSSGLFNVQYVFTKSTLATTKFVKTTYPNFDDKIHSLDSYLSNGAISGNLKVRITILEGDHTNTPLLELPYIEGIQSVGDKSKNLFDNKGFVNGVINATTGVFTIGSTYVNNVITNYYTSVPSNTQLYWSSNDTVSQVDVYEYDSNYAFIKKNTVYTSNIAFTTSATTKYIAIGLYKVPLSSSYVNSLNFQLEQGTTATTYEPYYEGYRVRAKSCGKNLIKGVLKDTGLRWVDGAYVTEIGTVACDDYIAIKPNTIYKLSCDVLPSSNYQHIYYDDKFNKISTTNNFTTNTSTSPNNAKYVRVAFRGVNNSSIVQLEEVPTLATTPTPYAPYVEDTKTYYLDEPLRSLPNGTNDEIAGSQEIRRVGKFTFSGNEDIGISSSINSQLVNCMCFSYILVPYAKGYTSILSDKFVMLGGNQDVPHIRSSYSTIDIGDIGTVLFYIEKSELSTQDVNGFKAWLQANPTTVYYELATPIVTELDEHLSLQTFAETTHITSDNYMLPVQKTKVPTNVQAVVSGLMVENSILNTELSETKNELSEKVELLNSMDSELFTSNWEMDFRLYEVEWFLEDNLQTRIKMDFNRGKTNMAMSKFEQAKVIILGGDYNRETLTRQLDAYLKRGLITQAEFDTLISMMDAKDFIVG